MRRITVGISACLLGEKVRYNGEHKLIPHLKNTLEEHIKWAPVCPEVGCGLGVPREPMQLKGDTDNPRLITVETGIDHTELMLQWSMAKARELGDMNLCGFVLKCRSPSCAVTDAPLLGPKGSGVTGVPGLFARIVIMNFPHIVVEDEEALADPEKMRNFLERVLGCGR